MAGIMKPQEKQTKVEPAPKGGPPARPQEFPSFLGRLRDEFDRMFERFAGARPGPWGEMMSTWRWGLEVFDKDTAVVVRAEAPGFEAGDFDVQVQDGQLTLRACHKVESKQEGEEAWSSQEYVEVVTLPTAIDKDKVQAKYRNGVLTVTLPKAPQAKGRRVTVEGA
ncbi:MAG: Hsp20/alpha crystallin family protein [Gemmataceae bacterium]